MVAYINLIRITRGGRKMENIKKWLNKYKYDFTELNNQIMVNAKTNEEYNNLISYLDKYHEDIKITANHVTKSYLLYK